MDVNFARRRLIAALAAVPAGKNLSDLVSVPGNCRETTVLLHAFNDAVPYLGDELLRSRWAGLSPTCNGCSERSVFQHAQGTGRQGNPGRLHGSATDLPENGEARSLETQTAAIARRNVPRAVRPHSVEMRTRAHSSIEASTLRPPRMCGCHRRSSLRLGDVAPAGLSLDR